jgi:hypothetical protein
MKAGRSSFKIKFIFLFILLFIAGQTLNADTIWTVVRNTKNYAKLIVTSPLVTVGGRMYYRGSLNFKIQKAESGTIGTHQYWINAWINSVLKLNEAVTRGNSGDGTWTYSYRSNVTVEIDLWCDFGILKDKRVGTISKSFYVDNTAPNVSIGFKQNGAVVDPIHWLNGPIVATATASDTGSGLAGAGWLVIPDGSNSSWQLPWNVSGFDFVQSGANYNLTITRQGAHRIKFRAWDRVGNLTVKEYTIKIDNAAPVSLNEENVHQYLQFQHDDGNNFTITNDWAGLFQPSSPADPNDPNDFPEVVSNSGFNGIYLSFENLQEGGDPGDPYFFAGTGREGISFGSQGSSAEFTIDRNIPYHIRLWTEDKTIITETDGSTHGNLSAPFEFDILIPEAPFIKQESLEFPEITQQDSVCYNGLLAIASNEEYVDKIQGLRLEILDGNEIIQTESFSGNEIPLPSETPESSGMLNENENGELEFSFQLQGEEHAHKQYAYRVVTTHTLNDFEGNYAEEPSKEFSPEGPVPNLAVNYSLCITTDFGETDVSAVEYLSDNFGGNINDFTESPIHYSKGNFTLTVETEYQSEMDIEGDTVSFRLLQIQAGDDKPEDIGGFGYNDGKYTYDLTIETGDEDISYIVVAHEEKDTVGYAADTTTLNYNLNGKPYGIRLARDVLIDSEVDLTVTHRPPDGTFSPTPDIPRDPTDYLPTELAVMNPANTPYLALSISGIDPDESGYSEVLLFNIPTGIAEGIDFSAPFLDLSAYEPEEVVSLLPEGESQIAENSITLDWTLSGFDENYAIEDGRAAVVLKLKDFAGNVKYFPCVTGIDTVAPEAISIDDILLSYTRDDTGVPTGEVAVHLEESVGIRYFWFDETIANESTDPKNENSYYTDGLSPNTPFPVKIRAVDLAGNYSSYSGITLFTLPEAGVPLAFGEDRDGEGDLDLVWRIPKTSTAENHTIRFYRGELSGDLDLILPSLTGDGEEFSTKKATIDILPHSTYAFDIIPTNSGGIDGDPSPVYYRSVKNTAPEAPLINGPIEWGRSDSELSWGYEENNGDLIQDRDGDEVTYDIYLNGNLVGSTSETRYPLGETGVVFVEGNQYEWNVLARDTFTIAEQHIEYYPNPGDYPEYGIKETSSLVSSFVIDDTAPVIVVDDSESENLFTSGNVLVFSVTDTLSGVTDVFCERDSGELELIVDEENYSVALEDGFYQVTVRAHDAAGNPARVDHNVYIDTEAPVITGDVSIGGSVSGRYLTARSVVPVTVTVNDTTSGVRGIRYRFIGEEKSTDYRFSEMNNPVNPGISSGERTFDGSLVFDGVSGSDFQLEIHVVDWAGNVSEPVKAERLVMLDTSAPVVSVTLESGYKLTGGKMFISDTNTIDLSIDAKDTESGIESTEYSFIREDDGTALGWRNSLASLRSENLSDGTNYRIGVRARNVVELETIRTTAPFVFDSTSPSVPVVTILRGSGSVVPGEAVQIRVDSSDPDSGVVLYRLAIGTETDQGEVTEFVNGSVDGWLSVELAETGLFSFAIPDVFDGSYRIAVSAENGAGLEARIDEGETLTIDRAVEKIVVSDGWPFSSDTRSLKGFWNYHGTRTVDRYSYRIVTLAGETIMNEGPWSVQTDNSIELFFDESEELVTGMIYRIAVKAIFDDGSESSAFANRGVTIDATGPVFDEEAFITPYAGARENLSFNWKVEDDESGIERIEAIIHGYKGGSEELVEIGRVDLKPANQGENVPLIASGNGEQLSLDTGDTAYITMRITNGSGLVIDRISNAIYIDNTPPSAPLVIDQGDYINLEQPLSFHWVWSKDDPESGMLGYQWTLLRADQTTADAEWSDIIGEKRIPLEGADGIVPGNDGETWFLAVKSVNRAGLTAIGFSNGITFDSTAPNISEIKVLRTGFDPSIEEDLLYTNSTEGLSLFIAAQDDVSGVEEYYAAPGFFNMDADWILQGDERTSVSNLITVVLSEEVADGDITVFRGHCIDQAEIVSSYGYATGVMYDTSIPVVTSVHGNISGEILRFDWGVTGSNSPIVRYDIELISVTTGLTVYSAQMDGRILEIDAGEQNLPDDHYQLHVTAVNAAGSTSITSTSVALMMDRSPGFITGIESDRYVSKKINFAIEAGENLSRIEEFQYAVGTYENPYALSGKWLSRQTGSEIIQDWIDFAGLPGGVESVKDKTRIYIRVRVRNSAGLWSDLVESSNALVDKTLVELTGFEVARTFGDTDIILDSAYTNDQGRIDDISFQCKDSESGVIGYRLAVVSDMVPETLSNAFWKDVPAIANPGELNEYVTDSEYVSALALEDGESYYVVLQARNGAGDYSMPVYSNEVLADFTGPEIVFQDGIEDDLGRIIVNDDPVNIFYDLSDATSECIFVDFTIESPSGVLREYERIDFASPFIAITPFLFDEIPSETTYGVHLLTVTLTDAAGNITEIAGKQEIRVNRPPEIVLDIFDVTPGMPLFVMGSDYVSDDDGEIDYPLSYLWIWGDGEDSFEESNIHSYFHLLPKSQRTEYKLTLHVCDRNGKTASAETSVIVENTRSGRLYTDEYWSGHHTITGDVIVPEGLTLTTEDDTEVEVLGTLVGGFDIGLYIDGILNAGANSRFFMNTWAQECWDGISLKGNASLDNPTIQNARRGLVVFPQAVLVLAGGSFIENQIGIHIFGSTPVLEGIVFNGNSQYAVKEDAGGNPEVINCIFTGNTFDYYDEEETVMDYSDVNTLTGNYGNTGTN